MQLKKQIRQRISLQPPNLNKKTLKNSFRLITLHNQFVKELKNIQAFQTQQLHYQQYLIQITYSELQILEQKLSSNIQTPNIQIQRRNQHKSTHCCTHQNHKIQQDTPNKDTNFNRRTAGALIQSIDQNLNEESNILKSQGKIFQSADSRQSDKQNVQIYSNSSSLDRLVVAVQNSNSQKHLTNGFLSSGETQKSKILLNSTNSLACSEEFSYQNFLNNHNALINGCSSQSQKMIELSQSKSSNSAQSKIQGHSIAKECSSHSRLYRTLPEMRVHGSNINSVSHLTKELNNLMIKSPQNFQTITEDSAELKMEEQEAHANQPPKHTPFKSFQSATTFPSVGINFQNENKIQISKQPPQPLAPPKSLQTTFTQEQNLASLANSSNKKKNINIMKVNYFRRDTTNNPHAKQQKCFTQLCNESIDQQDLQERSQSDECYTGHLGLTDRQPVLLSNRFNNNDQERRKICRKNTIHTKHYFHMNIIGRENCRMIETQQPEHDSFRIKDRYMRNSQANNILVNHSIDQQIFESAFQKEFQNPITEFRYQQQRDDKTQQDHLPSKKLASERVHSNVKGLGELKNSMKQRKKKAKLYSFMLHQQSSSSDSSESKRQKKTQGQVQDFIANQKLSSPRKEKYYRKKKQKRGMMKAQKQRIKNNQ